MAKKTKKVPAQISIATIGLIGVIVAAVIGLCGTIIAAYFGYLGIRAQIEEPIHATQTAQANLSSLSLTPASQSTTPSQSSSPTSTNSSPTSTEWQQFLSVDPVIGCVEIRLLPIVVNPSEDPAKQIANTNPTDTIVPINSFGALYSLANIGNYDWMRLDKSLDISVSAKSDVPNHVDVIERETGCGGTDTIRDFPSIILHSDLDSFTQKLSFPGIDYFTLQPGEFELFRVNFQCNTTGYFTVSPTIDYSYQKKTGTIEFPKFDVLCPQSFTVYHVAGENLLGVENYNWKDGTYNP